ncbi:aminopeptidase [Natronobiforma cellulositropha]|uniref:aminopeptidase n=1 Tax=Natronobiforma cellulositropha TaxID=1679076 RepID=UPI0021D59A4D|nr:hypothetical protein [Natronobiforma cellulositropha]
MSNLWSQDDFVRYADAASKPGRLQEIIQNTHKILEYRLTGEEERAHILTDTNVSPLIYHTVAGILSTMGVEPTISIIQKLDAPNNEPTKEVSAGVKETDVIVNLMTFTVSHAAAVEHARYDLGVDYILLADPTEDSFTQGAITADPAEVDGFTDEVADILEEADWIEVTSPYGTDVEFSIEGRRQVRARFPMGETPTCPIEETVNGTIVHESFMMGVGILDDPIIWEVEEGRIQEIRGGKEARALERYIDRHGDENSYWIGEFSAMTQPNARPNGNYIEHKQVRGGVHFACGTGTNLGGQYRSSLHLDGIQLEPTVVVDGVTLIEDGEYRLENF